MELFGPAVDTIESRESECVLRFTTAEQFVSFFRRWYGPTLKAFEALDASGQASLAADLAELAGRFDRNQDGGSVSIPSTYLETVISLR